jgi:hypothetical protein
LGERRGSPLAGRPNPHSKSAMIPNLQESPRPLYLNHNGINYFFVAGAGTSHMLTCWMIAPMGCSLEG